MLKITTRQHCTTPKRLTYTKNVLWFLQAIITLKMSSYIFVNKSRAALKERVEALELELANLKDHLKSDREEEEHFLPSDRRVLLDKQ